METQSTLLPNPSLRGEVRLEDFWDIPPLKRGALLKEAIRESHVWHYERNVAYRQTVAAHGVGAHTLPENLSLLLRPTAQTFKGYIDLLGTPFPQDCPQEFCEWLCDQLSPPFPRQRKTDLKRRYPSLEALLSDLERLFAEWGWEVLTSSGTSGRASILVRDAKAVQRTVERFYLCFQRYFGLQLDHRAIFIMPRQSRIAMARMVAFSARQMGLSPEDLHFTIPYSAYPDQVRVRNGRLFRPGFAGFVERRLLHPFMSWMNEHYVSPRAVAHALALLEQAALQRRKVLLFASWVHLHALAQRLQEQGRCLVLPVGSLLGTGGGFKERYPYTAEQIRHDLANTFQSDEGAPIPLRDVYGMAEANWAAMQCSAGNYHIPPWVLADVLDDADRLQSRPQASGLLAFFDPFGGGDLFPAFFKTADRVHLVNPYTAYEPTLTCPCGEEGTYLTHGSIQRVDLLDEAGCAAQV